MAVFINDHFLENEEALLHVSDLSMQRGYAAFDFLRSVNAVPLFISDHLDRLFASAAAMHLPVRKSREELSSIIHELIKRSSLPDAGIRIMLTGGYSTDSYQPAEPNLLITCNPVKTATQSDFEKGLSIITYEHQRELPLVKSINYLTAVWLQPLLKEKQADDVLYFKNRIITEFPRSNVFIITADNKLVTPARNILLGITRKNVLTLAADIMPVEERDITVDELQNAAEVFLTSTTKKIMPVVKVNNKIIGNGKPGKISTTLYKKFLELEKSTVHLVSL
jgi:D-alanine transaminase/branched-chain amino acid aminotransferase